jgi:hypothetical protein
MRFLIFFYLIYLGQVYLVVVLLISPSRAVMVGPEAAAAGTYLLDSLYYQSYYLDLNGENQNSKVSFKCQQLNWLEFLVYHHL